VFSPLNFILGIFSQDIGIDLGTANTLVNVRHKGIVINEPSVVAIERKTKKVLAIGMDAKEMVGRTPADIVAIRPLRDGVISDFDVTERMLHYFIKKVHDRTVLPVARPRVVVGIPSGVTEVEKRAVHDATLSAGAREAYLIEEPMAAAIGAELPIADPTGSMVLDIGGGTSEVGVISLGGIVYAHSLRIAGDKMDEAIINYIRRKYSLLIGDATAELIKKEIGAAWEGSEQREMEIKGRHVADGVPRRQILTSKEVYIALSDCLAGIVSAIKTALEQTPPELGADIAEKGLVVTGGGALLRDLDRMLAEQTGLPIILTDDPLTCVVRGCGRALQEAENMSDVFVYE
jgi:rod shape-determining protein MreB